MLPTLSFNIPNLPDFFHEVKYDGFRAILSWDETGIEIMSRNGKSLLSNFPEIRLFLEKNAELLKPFLPFMFDCELVCLSNPFRADFSALQVRGRLKAKKTIEEYAVSRPCHLMIFDLLLLKGQSYKEKPYDMRKEALKEFFQAAGFHLHTDNFSEQLLQFVKPNEDYSELMGKIELYDGEGIVSKKKTSTWEEGKRSLDWIKSKNWKYVDCFVTAYEKSNGYFHLAIYKEKRIVKIGQVLFGLKPDEKQALLQIIKGNKKSEDDHFLYIDPSICLQVKYLEIFENQLREPHFHQFLFHRIPEDCTYEVFQRQQKNLPEQLEMTHPEKPIWHKIDIKKIDYVDYLRGVSPYMLPFLKNRLLTSIRFPHGITDEAFFQKNCPDYAPEFVESMSHEGIRYIVCNNLETLIWLGNQLAIELHIPFQEGNSDQPDEIVFDLDPPSTDFFHLAIKAAQLLKVTLDSLNLTSFVKTSGNKGIQVYIPLPKKTFTYEQTGMFTSFMADFLVTSDPESFTIERLKKNRGRRLYIDYLQHGEGKTLIAPYSARGNDFGGVATPLYWNEVTEKLGIEDFNIKNTLERLKNVGDPFNNYEQARENQSFSQILQMLEERK
ncbi:MULTISPECIES: DNA ligase D [unclassified Bacillus (in: firmicutes)]|uniref:DNA ligase D n=1 Tax=unclassified Bacillus (in: firmicutes) TaxID=185979 RepID=UPI0020C83ED7|nr:MULTISPECIES: DNA ligase D [unclassified Bacillus (in: firmicutes)]